MQNADRMFLGLGAALEGEIVPGVRMLLDDGCSGIAAFGN
jgi:hypothetical protein